MRLFLGSKGNAEDRIMSTTNFSSGGSHTKSFQELLCSPSLVGGLQQQLSIFFVAVDIFLSITAFAGNSLILVALSKESSLHPPSKLLYRCLATTDLLVGQQLVATNMFLLNFQGTKLSERIRKKIIWEKTLVKGEIDASFND